jgi:hypothetical protein
VGGKKCIQKLVIKLEGRDNLGDLGIDYRMILKLLKKIIYEGIDFGLS